MSAWQWAVALAHATVSLGLFVYALHMYVLLFLFWRSQRKFASGGTIRELPCRPVVTVQIPLYNERYVAQRAIQAACLMDYPQDRLEVQVLDDSTDDTRDLVDEEVRRQRLRGIDISVVRRVERKDYKAGALQNGLEKSRGEFLAVFDADFVPPRDWLSRTVPDLASNTEAGWLQTRWGHLNDGESWLTRAQAIGIDGHFVIEQSARVGSDLFANFNGTAGLWRKTAIVDSGGWTGDTLTEDLDLSYRAQLRGWKMLYRPDVVVPAELPSLAVALKSQQFRWAKGSIQTARKHLVALWRSKLGPFKKIAATIHLTSYAIHLLMLLSVLLAFPMLGFVDRPMPRGLVIAASFMFLVGTSAPLLLYATCQLALYRDGWRRILALPVLMALGMGVSVSNGQAVLEALLGRKSPFIRTPKRGDRRQDGYFLPVSPIVWLEILLGVACAVIALLYFSRRCYPVAVLLGLYSAGFISVGLLTWGDGFRRP